MNWRAKPLVSYRVIAVLITTDTGLTARRELDTPEGTTVADRLICTPLQCRIATTLREWDGIHHALRARVLLEGSFLP
jgi:hypothetical protein